MKKLLICLASAALLASCAGNSGSFSVLQIDPGLLEFPVEGGTKTTKIFYANSWDMTLEEGARATVSPQSAVALKPNSVDSTLVEVYLPANTTGKATSEKMPVQCGKLTIYLTLQQAAE